ncbi:MAG: hypothetical protein LAP39_24240 [Acidobacteriia bacterium]|nr:hypothetical protein [Terriglobia bacterium]
MTIDELFTQLNDLSAKLESAPDDEATASLRILILQLNKQMIAEGFDPLAALDSVAPVQVEQLRLLMPQVDEAIATEKNRVQMIGTIISLAKIALRAAGVTLPAGF